MSWQLTEIKKVIVCFISVNFYFILGNRNVFKMVLIIV